MIIWLALSIPVLTIVALVTLFKKNIVWWELVIPVCVSFILIGICKFSTEMCQITDREYWGGYVTQAEYFEAWNERVSCSHPKYEDRSESYTDSDGKTRTRIVRVQVGYEHAYDVDYHSPYWQITDNNDITLGVSQARFDQLCKQFGNRQFVELNRNYHTIDGDSYVAMWEGQDNCLEPVVTMHSYINRIQASNSVYKFPEVDPKKYGLYDYPDLNEYDCPSILGYHAPEHMKAERAFELINSKLGKPKKVRVWVVIFKNKPRQAGHEQQCYWQGGNKNELIITIGVNKQNEVQWSYVFGWTKSELLKIQTRDFISEQKKLNLVNLSEWLIPKINEQFVRRDFTEFSYLTVEPPGWMIALTFFLTLLVNVVISFWIVKNEYDEESGHYTKRTLRYGGY